jgi:hypothetical protein
MAQVGAQTSGMDNGQGKGLNGASATGRRLEAGAPAS